jgi:gliding motility-associated-like protein
VIKKLFILLILSLSVSLPTHASHVIGGEYTYTYLGNNQYRVVFYIYRDCINGNEGALQNDNPASFRVIDMDNINQKVGSDDNMSNNELIVPTGFSNACINNPPPVCVNRIRFTFDVTLPPNTNGYTIAYQRCCRNEAQNISNSGGSSVGASYYCTINPQFGPNNSAVFKNYPPQIICINNPLTYDNSAVDIDGDSLSYELCEAKNYFSEDVKPSFFDITAPNYPSVPYSNGFSAGNPMAGNPQITIDPITGIFSGTPTQQGRYVVTICCTEWRNGNKINVQRRDFQFDVTNCSKAVIAQLPVFSTEPKTYIVQCSGLGVLFKNISTGGFKYDWDFGVAGSNTDTSTSFEPTFVYPDTGTYIVKLVVNRGSTCADSIEYKVKVFPTFETDFSVTGLECPNSLFQFSDSSKGSLSGPDFWDWSFGDGTKSGLRNPTHIYNASGNFPVRLISRNNFGCTDTATKFIDIPRVNVSTSSDTIVLQNTDMQLYANGASTYTWLPNLYMDDNTKQKPNFFFPNTGIFNYIIIGVTENGCIDTAKLKVTVVKDEFFYMPNAFTPNGDGVNDDFKVISAGMKKLNYFRIYNRYGQSLFYTTNFLKGWDGTFNRQDCDAGTYFWMAEVVDIKGVTLQRKGDVTIVR